MIKQFFIQLFRNSRTNKTSFFISLIGLSFGFACAIIIYLWVYDELSVDKFHTNDSQLFQVMMNYKSLDNSIETGKSTPSPLAKALADEFPEVKYAVVTSLTDDNIEGIITVGDKHIKALALYASKNYFNVFSFPIIYGDRNSVLQDLNGVVISDKLAIKLFNTTDTIIGKIFNWDNSNFTISGVFKNPPYNSTIQFDLLFNFELFLTKENLETKWSNGGTETLVVLNKNTDIEDFNTKIHDFLKTKDKESDWTLFIHKFSDNYLFGDFQNGVQSGGRITHVRLFCLIALLILIIASINFINLSIANAIKKRKEVGIRKTLGASKKDMITKYLGESLFISILSMLISFAIVAIVLNDFNFISGKQLGLNLKPNFILFILLFTLITGIISGIYPALYISKFNPIYILKGKSANITGKNTSIFQNFIKNGMVIFQFSISIILIVSVFVIYKQIQYIQHKNLGFNKENIISFQRTGELNKNIDAFINEIKNIPGVVNASYFINNITYNKTGTSGLNWQGNIENQNIEFKYINANYDFIETTDIKLSRGRSFSKKYGSEKQKIIFNELAVKKMGLKNPIGQTVKLWGNDMQIVGVVEDFHFESLYEPIRPCFIKLSESGGNIIAKIQNGAEKVTIDQIGKLYKEFNINVPFEFKYLDSAYQNLYASEIRVSKLSEYFAGIAVFLACIGLFGLAAFSTQKRTKEIGIRKVHGSTSFGIIRLLSFDFIRLVIISNLIGLPLGYLINKNWLNRFAYKIDLELWIFLIIGLLTIMIAWITVGLQAFKAANMNPVVSLKAE